MKKVFVFGLIILFLVFGGYLIFSFFYQPELPSVNAENIIFEDGAVVLDSMTIEQKLAQMIVVRGDSGDFEFTNLSVGGIFLDRQDSEEEYRDMINEYQSSSGIKLFVSTDLEGAWTPFHDPEPHQEFPHFSDIESSDEAYDIGTRHGELLKDIGFNLNFAPVAEYADEAYGGRVFMGSKEEISNNIASYISGLQQNVLGTCKHYPGNAMKANLHFVSDKQVISEDDLELFDICYENNVSSIMVSHHIVYGEVDSLGRPSSVSEGVVSSIDDSVLVIADEINMRSLSNFYSDKAELYVDLVNSGENLILDFHLSPFELYSLVGELKIKVDSGEIDSSRVDISVRKILKLKGYEVV